MGGRDQTRTYSRKDSVVFLKTDEPFGGLSNMAGGYPIHVNGVRILTSEALYQVCRFPHLPDVQKLIIGQISPMTAKMRSKPYRKDSRPDWDQVRVRIMRWSLRMKLANNWNTFSALLLKTGDRPIVEESRKDDFWGAKVVDDGDTLAGMNVLGRLLMELREQVKQQGRDATLDIVPPDIPQFLLLGLPIEVVLVLPPPQSADDQEQGVLFGTDATVIVEAPAAAPLHKAAYKGYRPGRMRWLPPVPEHWSEQRAKTFFREVDERSKTGQEELLSVSHLTGITPRSQKNVTMFKAASYVGSKLCRPGDIVVNTLWAWMAALGASRHEGIVSPAYGVYRPHHTDSFNPAYLDYLLRTRAYVAEYIGRSTGIRSSRLRLYPNQFLDIALLQPPRSEQDQIVAYLRAQDAHIARLIKAKRDLIGLLTEQKLRIIDHAVTRGLNASVALKPSGIEWLGDVPEHWLIKPLKRWVRLNASTLGEKTNPDFEFRYLDIGSVKTGRLAKELERLRFENAPSRARRVLRRGDTIISTVRTYLKAIWYVNEEADDLIASTGFAVLTPGREVEPEYLGYVIQSTSFVNRVTANSIGIAYPAIAETVLGRFPVVMPSTLEEQQAILAHIKVESAPLDQAIEQALTEIKLIREYRDRQIADVVTGQVDVRGWMPGPDDVVTEENLAVLGGDEEIDTDGEEDDGDD
ncbi:NADAR domain-containing protein [Acidithiobacillus ferrooxidans]|uniref:NADAR domain-containing protein n=1 Tax=Acidithiobacillus ferrooxidans TaxID=920 RepID=UPI000A64804A|nr:NADAR domain-containing protein [Acidithiobacillus ferrooxidans]MCR2831160.1 NADAR domain-containing protein [Acidithiobacillus ferrooxidans]